MPEEYFTQIMNDIIRSDKLTPNDKAVFNLLISYNYHEEIFVNQKTIAKESNMSRASVMRSLDKLRALKMITTEIKPDRSTLVYKIDTALVVSQSNKGCITEQQGVVAESDTINKEVNNKELKEKKNPPEEIPYVEILDYLKLKAKLPRGFSATNGNKKFINARWSEGHRLVDFKAVIDVKCDEWLGTKWAKFLRPKTLFNSENFDSYLNQPIQQPKEPQRPKGRIIT